MKELTSKEHFELIIKAMQESDKKLREKKRREGRKLVVMINGKIQHIDP